MKKKVVVISIIIMIAFLVSNFPTQATTNEIYIKPKLNQSDTSAPSLTFDISDWRTTGILYGEIYDAESNIHSYTVDLNGDNITNTSTTVIDSHTVEFIIDRADFQEGIHNEFLVTAFNDANLTSLIPTFNQGGGGGSGGGGFCQNPTCWHPTKTQSHETENNVATPQTITDVTAPTIFYGFEFYNCCGIVYRYIPTDPESTVTYLSNNEIKTKGSYWVYAENGDGLSLNVTVIGATKPPILSPTPAVTPFSAWSIFIGFFAVITMSIIFRKRKK